MDNRALALVLSAAALGCGASPTQTCKDIVAIECKRAFECFSQQEQKDPQFIAAVGASESECNSKLTSTQCATITDGQPCTDSSKMYHGDKAQAVHRILPLPVWRVKEDCTHVNAG